VKAVEKEKDDLEGVKNEAIEYLTLENDISKKRNNMYQKFM
jgi:structural maintenance of chromosome 4